MSLAAHMLAAVAPPDAGSVNYDGEDRETTARRNVAQKQNVIGLQRNLVNGCHDHLNESKKIK